MFVEFAGLKLQVPENWFNISADLSSESLPTLACEAGVGALQFSVAAYRRGVNPTITEGSLNTLFVEFCKAHSFSGIEPSVLKRANVLCIGGVSTTPKEIVAVWYLSDGTNIALVTYTSLKPSDVVTKKELVQATGIVESIEFIPLE